MSPRYPYDPDLPPDDETTRVVIALLLFVAILTLCVVAVVRG